MTALIILACVLAYLASALFGARLFYGHLRAQGIDRMHRDLPYSCPDAASAVREWENMWRGETMLGAGCLGLIWPLALPLRFGSRALVAFLESTPVLSQAEAAEQKRSRERRITQLEAENERLRRQQEGRLG